MRHQLAAIDLLLWWSIILLKIIAVAVVSRPSVRRTFPRFALYIVVDTLTSLALYYVATWLDYAAYVRSAYASVLLIAGLTLNCLYEIMLDLFQPFTKLPRGLLARTVTFFILSTSLLITMIWVGGSHLTPRNWSDAARIIRDLQIGNGMLAGICVLVLWIVVYYARELGLPWTDHAFAIAFGFAIALTTDLIFSALIGSSHHVGWQKQFRRAGQLGYLAALLVWTICLAKDEPTGEPMDQAAAMQIDNFVHKLDLFSSRLSISSFARAGEALSEERKSGPV